MQSPAGGGKIDKDARPGQHRKQAPQYHLVQRIDHLAALALVKHVIETPHHRPLPALHRRLPPTSRPKGSPQNQHFVPLPRTSFIRLSRG